ncbi:MAG: di-trans,poly-cis-decaprenylcistransferase [Holosporaceae bacterium]|jgi:undecaprenyl diphosphate synthase|nr:di-trans,poly-cis-decaprenylcistransferase [Holosporaceae bacterium]
MKANKNPLESQLSDDSMASIHYCNSNVVSDELAEIPTSLQHIAIIIDGNRRWAVANGLSRLSGHKKGYEKVKEITFLLPKYGIKYVTYYLFSFENWNRSAEEVGFIMNIFRDAFRNLGSVFHEHKARFIAIGNLSILPEDIQKSLAALSEETSCYDTFTVIAAISYSGRDEILRAAKKIAADAMAGKLNPHDLSEDSFSSYLDTKGIPYPCVVVRTSEKRLSNFLIWQSTYSEIFFLDKLWPDFSEDDLKNVIDDFSQRKRRYGR